jgi:hypothetical protein
VESDALQGAPGGLVGALRAQRDAREAQEVVDVAAEREVVREQPRGGLGRGARVDGRRPALACDARRRLGGRALGKVLLEALEHARARPVRVAAA